MFRLFLIWFISSNWFVQLANHNPQSIVTFNNVEVQSVFGESISFTAVLDVEPNQDISHVYLFIQPEEQDTLLEEIKITNNHQITYKYDVSSGNIRPFSQIDYWFRVYLIDGQEIISPKYSYRYNDDRFEWQTLENDLFQVGWNEGNLEFGQMIMNISQNGLLSAQTYLPGNPNKQTKIYVYSSASDLQSAIQQNGETWIAGHAMPEVGVILVSIPQGPEARLEMERQIPHEIMHIQEYMVMGEAYSNMPLWLIEGLASLAELYPNSEYQLSLETAVENGTLIPVSSLCTSFPSETNSIYLAYAESASFVRFLHRKYGTTGMNNLITAYKDGIGCEEAFETAFNTPMSQLEYRWQQESLGIDAEWLVFENLSPYLFILLLVLLVPVIAILQLARIRRNASESNG